MKLERLHEELSDAHEQLEYLHYSTASPECIEDRRASLQCRIMMLEEEIEYQKRLIPLRIATGVFIIGAISILLYFIF